MGLSKSHIFSKKHQDLALFFRVLSNPARLAIIENIIKQENCICGDLVNEIGLAQPTISQHLKEIKSIGLIKGHIEGPQIKYCIDTKRWQEIKQALELFFIQSKPFDCSNDNK